MSKKEHTAAKGYAGMSEQKVDLICPLVDDM